MKFRNIAQGVLAVVLLYSFKPSHAKEVVFQSIEECAFPDSVQQVFDWIDNRVFNKLEIGSKILENHLSQATNLTPICEAWIFHKKGAIAYWLDESEKAILFNKKALAIRERLLPEGDESRIHSITNLAVIYYTESSSRYLDSVSTYLDRGLWHEAARTVKGEDHSQNYRLMLQLLARHSMYLGDHVYAKNALLASVELYERDKSDYYNLGKAYNSLCELFALHMSAPDSALHYGFKALHIYRGHPENETIQRDTLNVLFNLGLAYSIWGEKSNRNLLAVRYLKKADSIYARIYPLSPSDMQSRLRQNRSIVFSFLGNDRKALKTTRGLLQESGSINDSYSLSFLADNFENMGDFYRNLNLKDSALFYYNLSIESRFAEFEHEHPFDLPDFNLHPTYNRFDGLRILQLKAQLIWELYEEQRDPQLLDAALDTYKKIDDYISVLRRSFVSEGSRISLAKLTKPIYEQAIVCSFEKFNLSGDPHYAVQALSYAENSKATSMLEQVKALNAAKLGLQKKEQNRFFYALQKYQALEKEIAYNKFLDPDSEALGILTARVEALENVKALEKEFQENYPTYYSLRYDTSSYSLTRIEERILHEDRALVEYFVGDSSLFAFLITQGNVKMVKLPYANLDSLVQGLHYNLRANYEEEMTEEKAQQTTMTQYLEAYVSYSRELYRILIEPLGELPPQLILIPDEVLLNLPFEVLLSQEVENLKNYTQYPYWIKEKAISYNFSLAILDEILQKKELNKTKRKFWMGFAPLFPKGFKDSDGKTYGTLTHSTSFVENIGSAMNENPFIQEAASLLNLQEKAGFCKILHLATHGFVNDTQDSSLVRIALWDTVLYLEDVFMLPLQTDLTILNACKTNLGKMYKGEGIMSLNRGFVSAGSSSVLATLWSPRDVFIPKFMDPFYQGLAHSADKATALQEAKWNTLRTDHPYYWAPFVLYGDVSPIEHYSYKKYLWWALALVLILLAYQAINKKYRNSTVML